MEREGGKLVNRESIPLITALLVPFVLVGLIVLYYYGYDITVFLRQFPIVYYIALIPIVLGFIVVIAKYANTD